MNSTSDSSIAFSTSSLALQFALKKCSTVMTSLISWAKKEIAQLKTHKSPKVQEVVIEADVQCIECQKRLADAISRMLDTAESMVVHVSQKKVTLNHKSQ
ncbi:uncharacterized protein LOC114282090 isoform X2 [Camellia sinensis]|uniref:uncharacterized protein LOC114282090 isoform X2 n=1 Tax=Camellia sinensis TaxID=4442 RepID=UPI001035C249|nr:uncharacterized protein LOC114282090 isoform X2 [Camellia sinensis]